MMQPPEKGQRKFEQKIVKIEDSVSESKSRLNAEIAAAA